jgi:hypothetical protein
MIKGTLSEKKIFMSKGTIWRLMNMHLRYTIPLILLLFVNVSQPKAQGEYFWSEQARIPEYPDFTQEPPFLIADRNNTVHAFNSQALNLEDDNSPSAIFYRQWTKDGGWTNPNDIIYNSAGGSLDILGAASDSSGMVYLIYQQDFFNIYFTYAYLANAGSSTAWSQPVLIAGQSTHVSTGFLGIAAIAADGHGNIVVIYSGSQLGKGLYSVTSSDGGASWSDPYPVYLTGDETMSVTDPALVLGQSGSYHAVWATYLSDGGAGPGFYSKFDPATKTWTDPTQLDVPGIRTPDVTEYNGQIIVSYYHDNVNGNWWRLSSDGGKSWSLPSQFSPRFVGTNGRVSFAVDSKNTLYAFFGERINDLNHGMWQCIWTGYAWTDPEPVVKGPQVRDVIGGNGFDPRAARAVVSNGNVMLVTWTTDGFAGENGAWYSYKTLDAPALPAVPNPYPTPNVSVLATDTPVGLVIIESTNTPINLGDLSDQPSSFLLSPQTPIFSGAILVLVIIVGLLVLRSVTHSRDGH